MRYQDFLTKVVEASMTELETYYHKVHPNALAQYFDGSAAGIKACLDKSPPQLTALIERAHRAQRKAHNKTLLSRYLWIVGYLHEVSWICDVISTALVSQNMPPIVHPSVRAAMMASQIMQEVATS